MERFEHVGHFWLPEEPGEKIPGKLSFGPAEGGELKLMGSFSAKHSIGEGTITRFAIIHGYVTGDYHRVTLSKSYVQTSSGNLHKDYKESKLPVERIYMSKQLWFSDSEDVVFESLTVDFTHLSDWLIQNNSTSRMLRSTEDSVDTYRGNYTLQCPDLSSYDGARIEIWPAKRIKVAGRTERSVKYDFRFTITPRKKLHLNEYLSFIDFYLPNFLNFATGSANYPISIYGGRSHASTEFRIFYRFTEYIEKRGMLLPGHMLFTFEDVRDTLAKYLSVWISNGEKLWTVYDLYSKSNYRRGFDFTTDFLDLARALEVYHRSFYGGEYLTKEEYEPIKAAIIDAIPECVDNSHRASLESTLNYGQQYSLRTRLKRIIRKVLVKQKDDVEKWLGNPTAFIHRVVETRNYLTHLDGEPNAAVQRDKELFALNRKMRMLLRICLLKELDFPSSEITRLLNANREYRDFSEDGSS